MNDKFLLSLNENIFLAKKTIVENIYHSAKLEGCNVTFPETKTILDGISVSGVDMDDVQVIMNLRNAWKYQLSHIDDTFSLEYLCKINSFISYNESIEWGVLRNGNVGISGVSYIPSIPKKEDVENQLEEIMKINNVTERAIRYFLWGMRSQLFWDGNKRTSTLCANKILIKEGRGLLSVQEKDLHEFNTLLSMFYESNDYSVIDEFVYEKCIYGIERD